MVKSKTNLTLRNLANSKKVPPQQTDRTFCSHFKAEMLQTGSSSNLLAPPGMTSSMPTAWSRTAGQCTCIHTHIHTEL